MPQLRNSQYNYLSSMINIIIRVSFTFNYGIINLFIHPILPIRKLKWEIYCEGEPVCLVRFLNAMEDLPMSAGW
jgi:hypothetical protein